MNAEWLAYVVLLFALVWPLAASLRRDPGARR